MRSNLDLAIPKVVDGNGKPISIVGTDSRSNLDDGSPTAGKSSIRDRNRPEGLLIRDETSPEFPGQDGSPGVKSEQPAGISGQQTYDDVFENSKDLKIPEGITPWVGRSPGGGRTGRHAGQEQITKSPHQKCLAHCMESWDRIIDGFLGGIDKEIGNMDNYEGNFKVTLMEMQKRFAKHFERNTETTTLLIRFCDNYNRFAEENPFMLFKDYTQKQLVKKAEDMHDRIWAIISEQKDIALKEKDDVNSSGWIDKEVDRHFS
jgi:hypothetical protein